VLVALAATPGRGRAASDVVGGTVYRELRSRERVRVIVSLREPDGPVTDLTLRAAQIEAMQRDVVSALRQREFALTHAWTGISALAGDVTLDGLASLADHPDVVRVDVDAPARAYLAESKALVGAPDVQAQGITGKGVVVAVLDTGVDSGHRDLADDLIAEQCFCSSGGGCCPSGAAQQSGAGSARDDNGHGTNVTGVITGGGSSAPTGVAPDAEIVAVRVLDRNGAGTSTDILSGLDFIITSRPEVKVINMSLGLDTLFSGTCDTSASFTSAFASAVRTLRGRGVSVFAATGNSGNAQQIGVPACITGVVGVGAVYDGDVGTVSFGCTDSATSRDKVACFSNSSSVVDLLAPGAAITATARGGGSVTFIGTSQACPHAAAAAALLLEAKPGLSPDQIEGALKSTGPSITDPRNGIAFRRLDVRAALSSVR
jgi:subtilisin family serine protease